MAAAGEPNEGRRTREATPAELKALSNPLRLQILRACRFEPRTNKEIADAVGQEPATTLHHVRMLVDTGFLEVLDPRRGPRGSREKPYRATGKSWHLELPKDAGIGLVSMDATRAELLQAGPERVRTGARLGLRLSAARAAELEARLDALVAEYADARPDDGGDLYGLHIVFHELGGRP